jgi:glycosyltransferase involved in cell wall biosynthesis
VLLFPTTHHAESQGLVAVEAMAMGLPVVASDWRGPRDVVIDGETGSLLAADDVEGMVDALAALFDDPALARRLGAAGRARFEKHYRLETHLAAMHAAMHAAVAGLSED